MSRSLQLLCLDSQPSTPPHFRIDIDKVKDNILLERRLDRGSSKRSPSLPVPGLPPRGHCGAVEEAGKAGRRGSFGRFHDQGLPGTGTCRRKPKGFHELEKI